MNLTAAINIETINEIARKAGEAILSVYHAPTNLEVAYKSDQSPLTLADTLSNQIIISALQKNYPELPIISEENKTIDYEIRKKWTSFWLIDPLDGTKEFIKKNGEFTVNIALIENQQPVIGVVYVPISDTLYFAQKNSGAFKQENKTIVRLPQDPTHYRQKNEVKVVVSRSHLSEATEKFIHELEASGKKIEQVALGSSLKICNVAEGLADVYPRFGPTMEWDTAAAHAIAAESGRKLTIIDTDLSLQYNKPNLLNPYFLVA